MWLGFASTPTDTTQTRVAFPTQSFVQLMSANQQLRKSTDFIYILSPWCALFYGCEHCLAVPLRSCSWWRTIRPLSAPAEGLTESSGGGGNKPKAHWRCGNCLEEWTWGKQGATRVFAIGGNDDKGDASSDYIYAYIGLSRRHWRIGSSSSRGVSS